MSARAATRDRRGWLLAGVALLGIGVIALWWSQNYELKEVELPMPPRGEAAFNPLYALKRALVLDGVDARSRRRLTLDAQPLAPADTVLLLGDLRALPPRDADRLIAWVQRGGHLVAAVPSAAGLVERPDQEGPLLRALGITLLPADGGCTEFHADPTRKKDEKPPTETSVCSNTLIVLPEDMRPALRWGDEDQGDALVRLRHGAGSIDLVSNLQFATNQGLENTASAALVRQLLAPNYGRGTVHLVYDAEMPPLWRLLLERGWMAWLPLVLATLGWLWWRTQRRGPLLPSPPAHRRSLLEHVQASGEHVHRYGRGHLLHASLRKAFEARLRRRDPYAASLTGDAQRAAIAARTGLPESEVEAALRAPVPFVAADLRLRIAKLNRLRHRL